MRLNVEVPEDIPPNHHAHPNWEELVAMQKRGRPPKFVTDKLYTKCARCGEWKHLSQFYARVKVNVYEGYGIPWPYCKVCHLERSKTYNQSKGQELEAKFGALDTSNSQVYSTAERNLAGGLKPNLNSARMTRYPEPEVMIDKIVEMYPEESKEALLRVVDRGGLMSIWDLWDQLAGEGLVTPVRMIGRHYKNKNES